MELLLDSGSIRLILPIELIEEFLDVAKRQKFIKFFKKSDVEKLLNQVHKFGEIIEVVSQLNVCRDAEDNFLLSLAIDGKADYLITGDSDLLVLGKIENTKIVTWTEFIDLI
ncbi:putative toxin-antitoxin system toxin component, PIN family [Aquiflexum sp. LQ15W]|nr:putative toxin-antitoxin system toxin component, PIN family [Cognataquiflexum nitidum]MCH6202153.1 putative toxin-antitoxin system toxin component, PIN family [Cognataquiflexum nitidum]